MISIFNGNRHRLGEGGKKEIYIEVEVALRDHLHCFKPAEFMVFMAISLRIGEGGECFPSYDTLEADTGLTRATIAKAVKGLEKLIIDGHHVLSIRRERDERGHFKGNNIYRVFPESVQSLENPTLGKPNFSKSTLEEEPVKKETPVKKERKGGANGAPALTPSQPKERHPFVVAFQEQFRRNPNKTQTLELEQLPAADVDRWRDLLRLWALSGWNPSNIGGMIDRYKKESPAAGATSKTRIVNGQTEQFVGGVWYPVRTPQEAV